MNGARVASRIMGLALCVCAAAAGPVPAQSARTIEVTLSEKADSARNRVVTALIAQGLVVTQAQGPVVQTAPYRFNPATFVVVTVNLVEQDSVTRVVLSGAYSIPTLGVRDEPMTETTSRLKGQLWSWLKAIALKVQADPRGSS